MVEVIEPPLVEGGGVEEARDAIAPGDGVDIAEAGLEVEEAEEPDAYGDTQRGHRDRSQDEAAVDADEFVVVVAESHLRVGGREDRL